MKTQEQLKQSNASTLHDTLEAVYLDWVNNFLSINKFAEYYGITEEHALHLINISRDCNLREKGYY